MGNFIIAKQEQKNIVPLGKDEIFNLVKMVKRNDVDVLLFDDVVLVNRNAYDMLAERTRIPLTDADDKYFGRR